MPTIELGVRHTNAHSSFNSKLVLDAVRQRFPDWADQCRPYINVLTLEAWNQRGYRVKKGEKAIRIARRDEVWEENKESGERIWRGWRSATTCVFALPQVEKKN